MHTTNPIIKAAQVAKNKISKLKKESDMKVVIFQTEAKVEDDRLYTQIADLKEKQRDINREYGAKIVKVREKYNEEVNELYPAVDKLKKILLCMSAYKYINYPENEFSLEMEVKSYKHSREKELILIDKIKNEYLNLEVDIVENDKPKNKFSLCFVGKSIFYDEKLIKYPKTYGSNLHVWSTTMEGNLKDAQSIDELKLWYE